jgi:hypothetical protein
MSSTVVLNGLRHLLPVSTPFQPFPSEIFGVLPGVSYFQGRLPRGRRPFFIRTPSFPIATIARHD